MSWTLYYFLHFLSNPQIRGRLLLECHFLFLLNDILARFLCFTHLGWLVSEANQIFDPCFNNDSVNRFPNVCHHQINGKFQHTVKEIQTFTIPFLEIGEITTRLVVEFFFVNEIS